MCIRDSIYYAPMIGKLIVWATTRQYAIERLRRVLYESKITGVKTNLAYMKRIMHVPDFVKGEYNTLFIEKNARMLVRTNTCLLYTSGVQTPSSPTKSRNPDGWHRHRIALPWQSLFQYSANSLLPRPVSYTHLDVYKRQACERAQDFPLSPF